ncbi:AP2/ERF and B3 domain-containing transcription factor [Hibiscus syriacus]|uniref:AP2/ERF and B3 domain-containing transcription factor n=1 Tax=Hibiscus syriacus TaxID=106335 RepID=A0A6A2Z4W7_HIBSY|nr:AP2/ERF and B3 domain-containing transcription factor At1g50680-like [Hibiscus syriacus]KAE8686420.1 AP2/ERF and B3 domain-containing transcription factor [Hibiscus syriacus]
MVEDDSSIVSDTKLTVSASETSDSGNGNYKYCRSKRARHDHGALLARFKVVVPQQNGHWGAQIYANHHRILLGTFKSEREAAMAYDSTAIKLRSGGGDMHRNLPWTYLNVREPDFQRLYSTEDVLNMIRDGSYQAKLEHFVKTMSRKDGDLITNVNKKLVHGDTHFSCMQLFQKELTPSDVGKLNRLVIPKKYAVKHFPPVGGVVEDIELVFYDKLMVRWKFRYWYWRSSQSFVFTRGWRRFVKEKKLGEKDTVTFYTCECPDGNQNGRNFFLIDVNYRGESCCIDEGDKKGANMSESSAGDGRGADDLEVELELSLRGKNYSKTSSELNEDNEVDGFESGRNVKQKSATLFGVQIN